MSTLISFLVGEKINRKLIDYRLHGSSSMKIFRAFNALGAIAFSFGDAMLPEIQVHCCLTNSSIFSLRSYDSF